MVLAGAEVGGWAERVGEGVREAGAWEVGELQLVVAVLVPRTWVVLVRALA